MDIRSTFRDLSSFERFDLDKMDISGKEFAIFGPSKTAEFRKVLFL